MAIPLAFDVVFDVVFSHYLSIVYIYVTCHNCIVYVLPHGSNDLSQMYVFADNYMDVTHDVILTNDVTCLYCVYDV